MHAEALNLREVIVFLFAAGIVVPLFRRLKISPVFGFLVIGLVIGPNGIARFAEGLPWLRSFLITDIESVRPLAELGVVFLLFMIGLEISLGRLWTMRRKVFGLGGAQIVVTGALVTVIAWFFENSLNVSVVLGAGFALSSTAIVMQLLAENRRLGSCLNRLGVKPSGPHGKLTWKTVKGWRDKVRGKKCPQYARQCYDDLVLGYKYKLTNSEILNRLDLLVKANRSDS